MRTYRLERKKSKRTGKTGKAKGPMRVSIGNHDIELKPNQHTYNEVPEILATRNAVLKEFEVSLELEESEVKAKPRAEPEIEESEG
jgi:hypothetical protein